MSVHKTCAEYIYIFTVERWQLPRYKQAIPPMPNKKYMNKINSTDALAAGPRYQYIQVQSMKQKLKALVFY